MATRDDRGRFLPGHAALPGGGRPPGAVSVVTKTLRQEILDGFGPGGVSEFVKTLRVEAPAAAAGLVARLLPSDPVEEPAAGGTVSITLCSVRAGDCVADGIVVSGEEARQAWLQRLERERLEQIETRRRLGLPDTDDHALWHSLDPPKALEVLEVDTANVVRLKLDREE